MKTPIKKLESERRIEIHTLDKLEQSKSELSKSYYQTAKNNLVEKIVELDEALDLLSPKYLSTLRNKVKTKRWIEMTIVIIVYSLATYGFVMLIKFINQFI